MLKSTSGLYVTSSTTSRGVSLSPAAHDGTAQEQAQAQGTDYQPLTVLEA
jgi:hypothetical protein